MRDAGVIGPTLVEWASLAVIVPKKDGTLRFCFDYGKLNAVTVWGAYPMSGMDECIDLLGDETIYHAGWKQRI